MGAGGASRCCGGAGCGAAMGGIGAIGGGIVPPGRPIGGRVRAPSGGGEAIGGIERPGL